MSTSKLQTHTRKELRRRFAKYITERLFLWLLAWAYRVEGLVGVLLLGFYRSSLSLVMAQKLARWRWENMLAD